jgi:hypothetical protein
MGRYIPACAGHECAYVKFFSIMSLPALLSVPCS